MRITQRKGDIATTCAVATFTKLGYDVSLPVTESAKYDLIVDCGAGDLKRVQVKYSKLRNVGLRRVHSNSQGYVVKMNAVNDYDWLYVFYKPSDTVEEEYLFKECFAGRNAVSIVKGIKL